MLKDKIFEPECGTVTIDPNGKIYGHPDDVARFEKFREARKNILNQGNNTGRFQC